MKKAKYLISALLVLILSAVAVPVMAIGHTRTLDTPSGVHNVWIEDTGHFHHWINASKGEGKMNNAVIVGPNADVTLSYLLTHLSEYENTWIYFSQIGFKAFLIYGQGIPAEEAEELASIYPDGIYWHFVYVG